MGIKMGMRKIYRKIAKKQHVTTKEVKEEMQSAINYAYQNSTEFSAQAFYQKQVIRKGEIPTIEEIINFAKLKISEKEK